MNCNPEIPKDEQRQIGKCHVCKKSGLSIGWCNLCCHWFCRTCKSDWIQRSYEAIKERIFGKKPHCCGPNL